MKKNFLLFVILLITTASQAQQRTSGLETGVGFGAGLYTGEYSSMLKNVTASIEGDYYITRQFSIFGHIDYNRTFSSESVDAGSFGFATSHIGPRVHFSKVLFAGAGAGALLFTGNYGSTWDFSYLPQIGVVLNHLEFTAGYKGWVAESNNNGIIELGVVFKFNRIF